MSTATAVTMLDVRAGSGAITLPLTTQIPYRVITIKDAYGAAALSSITINTQGTDVFENGASSITLTNAYDTTTLYAGLPGYWYTVGGSRLQGAAIGTLSTGVILNPLRLGTLSTQTAIQFPGLRSNYTGTAITEQTTGAGTQELLLYKASSISDQIRLQTTGSIVFEAGAAARSWPSTTQLATPTLFIQGSTSNVGIGTAAPAATLDVAGAGRFQTLSTQSFNVSTINGIVPGAAFNGSTLGLSTATLTTSTLATNALTTSSITSYGTVDVQGNVLSNVGTEYFIKPLYTTTFLPTNISGLKVWLDASKPTSITSNGSGQVATWSNLTGLGNAVQITASNTPVTGQLSINSLNTMQFNAISQMTFGPISYSNTSRIVFAVLVTPFNPSVNGKTTFIFGGQADGSIGTAGFHAYQWSGSGFEFTTSTGGGQSAGYITYTSLVNAGTFSSSTAWLLTYHSGFGIFLNGTSNAPSSNLNTGSITDIFGTTAQGTNVNSFYIAEFLHYDTSFTATQRQTVEGYLAWKWGFQATLNGAHPYLSVPPPPLGTALLAMGGITADTSSNISFSATNKIRLTAPVEIPTTLNTSSITVSSINGSTLTQLVSQPLQSTVQGLTQGLGNAGYISTSQLNSTVSGLTIVAANAFTGSTTTLSAGTINVSTLNTRYLSSVQGYVSSLRTDSLTVGGPTGYVTVQDLTTGTVSTGQLVAGAGFISSLQINSLSFGPSGFVVVSDVIANSLSTKKLNTQALYTNNLFIGNVSSQSAILFPGVDGNYKGTAIAEQTTGVGTQELLLYKVSSTTDQIRLQTTGNIVFEAGAASRSWNSTTQLATPTLYIAGSTSNVGVGTATPATTLDVAGTGRFQTLSSFALNVSSINGAAPGGGGTFNGSTVGLSTASVLTSSLNANAITTTNLTVNGAETVNFNGGSNLISYGSGLDTLSLKSPLAQFNSGIASLFFGNGTAGYPLARLSAVDQGTTYARSALIFQTATPAVNSNSSGTSQFQYTGVNQTFTVPAGVTTISVELWGAGGGHAAGAGSGGAGAYLTGNLTVISGGTYAIVVGQAGQNGSTATTYGGGGAGNAYGSSGGGRSAVQYILPVVITTASATGSVISYTTSGAHGLFVGAIVVITNLNTLAFNVTGLVASFGTNTFTINNTATGSAVTGGSGIINQELVNVGGGGGGGYQGANELGGYGAYIGTAGAGQTTLSLSPGQGGTQSAGGAGGSGAPSGGLLYGAASGINGAGGGGGGYYAGGTGANVAAGGGGSSYTSNPLFTLVSGANSPNLSTQAPATGISSYVAGVAVGGASGAGGPGLVVISAPVSYSLAETMRIANTGSVGIGTANPQALLHVSGMTYSIATSTQALTVSSINGAAPWQLSFLTSTVQALTSNISSMIDPTELTSSIVGLGTIGFVSTVGLTYAVASTAQGLGTFGYTSTNQLLSTTIGVYGAIGSNITTTVQPQFASTVMGLGTVGYVSTAFTGSTTSLSAATIVVSSLATNSAKTSSLTMYGTLNMSNNLLTNIYSALFTPTYSGNPNAGGGGTYTTYTSGSITYAIHTFTVTGTTNFTPVTNIISAQVLIIGGGGSGGGPGYGGGGGAGGAVYLTNQTITSSGGPYLIVVGTGGAAVSASGYNTGGNNGLLSSAFGSAGAGGGGGGSDGSVAGKNGGCGGGAGYGASAGTGSQGYNGGSGGLTNPGGGGGGGGMGGAGANYNSASPSIGGAGIVYSIVGYNVGYAAGGGAASAGSTTAVGGSANGTIIGGSGSLNASGTAGAANTGSGGGGCGTFSPYASGAGGSGIVIIAYPLNQFGITPYTVGTITGDATSNLSIQPVNNLNIVGTTQTSALLVASTFSTTFINATFISTAALQVSTINGEAFTAATPFTGSTLSLSTASIFTSSLRASTISVGGGAWMSNDGLYLSNVQAGGAVGKLITNAGYVKLVTATAWNGGYGAFAITGGDLTPKIYMNAGQAATGAQMAIGGFNPSPGAGISLDVFGTGRFSSISTFQAVTSSMGVGTATPQALLDVAGTGRFQFISTLSLQTSSINGAAPWQQSYLTSTTEGLGTLGYISTSQLNSTVSGLVLTAASAFTGSTTSLSAGTINVSTVNSVYLSSVQGYVSSFRTDSLTVGGPTGYVSIKDLTTATISTGQMVAGAGFISSLQINSLSFGPSGYVIVSDVIANSLSTKKLNTQALYTNNLYVGNTSTQSAILFPGIDGNYRGTAVAEQTTGAGTGELLLYKVSSTTDQIRLQTTGNIVFEAGAAARSWPSTAVLATPTLYIQGSTSNVGVGTATPAATLDVAGTGRFQTLSSYALNVSSINGAAPGGTFTGSTLALSTGSVYASNVMMSGPLNMNTNVISNAGTITESIYVSNMVLWFDGNDSTTLFQDGGGVTPVTADNQSVYLWKDKSIYATNATPVTTSYSAVPKSTYGTQNSKNGIYFGGTSGFQFSSANMPGGATSNATYFFVAKQSSSSPPGQSFSAPTGTILFTTGDQSQSAALRTTQNNSGMQVYIDGISPSGGSNWNSSVPYIQTLVVQSGQLIRRANGLQLDSTAFTGAVAANTGTGRISESFGSFYNYWNGQVYEVLVYNTYLLTSAMQQIEGYLAWKWGITLNAAHPYYAASPGITPNPSGTLTQFGSFGLDTANNIQITATNAIRLTSAVQIPTTLTTSSFTVSSINGLAVPTQFTGSTNFLSASLIQAPLLSTLNLNVSSINGTAQWQQSYLTSTVSGLATTGYISTTQLGSTVTNLITRIGAGGGGTTFVGSTTFLSASQILFSTQTGYNISSVLGFVSSLQVDELQIGTGFGIIALGDTNMSSISTLGIVAGLGNFTTINVSSINGAIPGTGSGTSFTGNLGTVSSLTALRFYGLTGTYQNTAVAEVSTGTGTQELLLYKISSISDQVRVQTTGNVIFETGVGARSWPTATRVLPPTFYIAGSNSNVGIGTSNPVTTLDVVGTGRFQTLSSLNITAGSINYSVAFV
jgi:hypothetical protein